MSAQGPPTRIYISVTHAGRSLTISGSLPHLKCEWLGTGPFQPFALSAMILELRAIVLSLRNQWGDISQNISQREQEDVRRLSQSGYQWKSRVTGGGYLNHYAKPSAEQRNKLAAWLSGYGQGLTDSERSEPSPGSSTSGMSPQVTEVDV